MKHTRLISVFVSAGLALGISGPAAAAIGDVPPPLQDGVEDNEGVLTPEEEAQLEKDLQTLFEVYLAQDNSGRWYVTEAGRNSTVSTSDLEIIAEAMNGGGIGVAIEGQNRTQGYAECVLQRSGYGFLTSAGREAIKSAINKRAWSLAAKEILKIVGKSAVKGGVVGLASSLAISAVWCATPWA